MKRLQFLIVSLFVFFNLAATAQNKSECLQQYSHSRLSSVQVLNKVSVTKLEAEKSSELSLLKSQTPELLKFPKLLNAKLTKKSQLTFDELKDIKEELIAYFKSFGAGKRVVIFTGATSLDPSFKPQSAWNFNRPIKKQTSGVVTVMQVMAKDIKRLTGVDVRFVTPEEFGIHYQMKYQDIIAVFARSKEMKKILSEQDTLAVHIMVEDQLGMAAKKFLEKRNVPYTTAYHTDFPQMAVGFSEFYFPKPIHNALMGGPKRRAFVEKALYNVLRKFHGGSEGIMVPTQTMAEKLIAAGFPKEKIRFWSHGVDIELFHEALRDPNLYPNEIADLIIKQNQEKGVKERSLTKEEILQQLQGRPVALFVGRISEEKNIRDFLDAELESNEVNSDNQMEVKKAIKVVIGTGPELEQLKSEYPDVFFLGRKEHDTDLPKYMASADTFVFPSLSETYGLVGPEAMAGGTPALSYRVQGSQDWNVDPKAGVMVEHTNNRKQNLKNLEDGWKSIRALNRNDVRAYAETIPWERSILEFLYFLQVLSPEQRQTLSDLN